MSRRTAVAAATLSAALTLGSVSVPPTRAADPLLDGAVPSPTRDGAVKGSGVAPEAQPTGRLIIRYANGVDAGARQRARDAEGLALVSSLPSLDLELVEPRPGRAADVLRRMSGRADVLFVEPEYRRSHMAGPTGEPLFGQQWALRNTGQTVNGFVGVPDVDMNVTEAWNVTTGRADLVVAFVLVNEDPIDHEWLIGDDDFHAAHRIGTHATHGDAPTEVTIPALETVRTTITFDEAGTVAYICHLPGHEAYGMVGRLSVEG